MLLIMAPVYSYFLSWMPYSLQIAFFLLFALSLAVTILRIVTKILGSIPFV